MIFLLFCVFILTFFLVKGKRNWYPWTFVWSLIWIVAFSYLMVWWAKEVGKTLHIPTEVSVQWVFIIKDNSSSIKAKKTIQKARLPKVSGVPQKISFWPYKMHFYVLEF